MLVIVKAPNPVLIRQTQKIGKINSAILKQIKEMIKALEEARDPEGVGLAAPQVGMSLQLFIIKQTPASPVLVFINPVLHTQSDSYEEKPATSESKKRNPVKLEGCLSLDNIWGVVKRHNSIIISYLDENGTYRKRKFTGFLSTIIQHEMDHLKGILFPKRVLEQNGKLYRSVKNEDGETIFEELEV